MRRRSLSRPDRGHPRFWVMLILVLAACGVSAQTPQVAKSKLTGTSWQLVRIEGPGGKAATPSEATKYLIEFQTDDRVSARIDCNGGRGRWKSTGASQIEFGPLGLTRVQCSAGSLHDRVVKDWESIRSYAIRENHLFLSLAAGGGTYEFRPLPPTEPVTAAVASVGPVTYQCTGSGNRTGALQATFYQTQPAMMLVEYDGKTRPAFAVPAASGSKYEAKDVVFWERGAEASVLWSGVELKCRRR
jgi:heat shock protein HslJ/membrane-bound inhibitor of C-type lysozyme